MKRFLMTTVLGMAWVAAMTGACGGDGGTNRGAVDDVAASDTAEDSDTSVSACGAAREALVTRSSAIVGGTSTWSPDILALTAAQALAVGGVLETTPEWGTEIGCTGTLVAPQVALTAAHCIVLSPHSQLSASQLQFAVGADLATPRHTFAVTAVHVHPDYDYWGEDASHDVAILELAEDATEVLGNAITPVPVNCDALANAGFVGQALNVVGYGALDKWGEEYGTERLWAVETITGLSSLDITVDGGGVQGVCYGDSGGPALFVRDGEIRVVGVLSWGDEYCGYEDHFVRADHECDFIAPYLPACGAETALGRCDGDVAVYCASDAVVRDDCTAAGQVCGADAAGQARCAAPVDPCGGETLAGRCEGEVAVYCDGGAVVRADCASGSQVCAADAAGMARCVAPDPCGGETFAGRCDGADAVWCEAGAVKRRPCGDCAMACGFVPSVGGYDCVAP